MSMMMAVGVILVASILSVTIKRVNPVFSLLISLAAVIWAMGIILVPVRGLIGSMQQIAASAAVDRTLYVPVLKIVGISVLVKIVQAFCEDAGQHALAVKINLIGVIASLTACVPLINKVVTIITEWL